MQVTPEAAERCLKDLLVTTWEGEKCEGKEDTLKLSALVSTVQVWRQCDNECEDCLGNDWEQCDKK